MNKIVLVLACLMIMALACQSPSKFSTTGDSETDGQVDGVDSAEGAPEDGEDVPDDGRDIPADEPEDIPPDEPADVPSDEPPDIPPDDGPADPPSDEIEVIDIIDIIEIDRELLELPVEDIFTDVCVSSCGNGIPECDEECDDGAGNSDELTCACRTDCTNPGCGDSVVDYCLGEQCDDGGISTGDGCDDFCLIEVSAECGDGHVDIDLGEECDDGNTDNGDGCSSTCQFEELGSTCGDTFLDGDEVCDNGTVLNADVCNVHGHPVCSCSPPCSCNPTCNLTATTSRYAGRQGVNGQADGDRLTTAELGGWGPMAVSNTHLYFADSNHNVIRTIDLATGIVDTIAGDAASGTAGYVNHTNGLNARFRWIEHLATDGTTLWAADGGNHVIRAVDLTSMTNAVSTVAGQQYASGPGRYSDNTNPMLAEFHDLRGLTYYNNVLYSVDGTAATLRSFDLATGEVATIAGSAYNTGIIDDYAAAARFVSPRYMASDNSGMLYIADTNGYHIRFYNTVTSYVGTFAGSGVQDYVDGVGTAASIHRPRGMTSDGTSIYWTEFNSNTIRQGVLATESVTTLVGLPTPGPDCGATGAYNEGVGHGALFACPMSVVYHFLSGSLFVYDGGNNLIRRVQ